MSDARWAARQGDALSHTSLMADLLGGVLEVAAFAAFAAIGALATAAVVAATGLTIATGGLGACVLGAVVGVAVGVAMGATGLDAGLSSLCEGIGNALFPPTPAATILTGSPDTFINGLPAARAAGTPPDTSPTEYDNDEADPSYLDMAAGFFSELWRPTLATPGPGVVPKPLDQIACTRHPGMPMPLLAEGSATVYINGQPAVRSGDRSSCGATVVSSGRISPNVVIGGPKVVVRKVRSGKTPGVGMAVSALMMLRGSRGNFVSNLPCMALSGVNGFAVSAAIGALTRAMSGSPNPVHAATGAKVLGDVEELDFFIAGILPVEWQRFYNSRDTRTDSLFGTGWSVAYEVGVRIEPHPEGGERLIYTDEQARVIDMGSIPSGGAVYSAGEGLAVRRHDNGQLLIESEDGRYRLFEPVPTDPHALRLTELGDRNDNRIYLDYDGLGRLIHVRDTYNIVRLLLVYSLRWPRRIEQIERVYIDETQEVLSRYDYDAQGDLAQVQDALGQTQRRFVYYEQRMVEHQLPSGLRCFYRWALIDEREWRVVQHWTDEGDAYRFAYDLSAGTTVVTDRLTGIRLTETAGSVQTLGFAYDALGQLLEETSSAGVLQHRYDELGNRQQTGLPDGRWLNRLHYGSGHLHQINLDGQVICDFERDRLHREVLRSQGQIATASQYDRTGRLSRRQRQSSDPRRQHPALAATEYEYDPTDNLIERRGRQSGLRHLLGYDSSHRILGAQDSRLGILETLAYDPAANLLDGPKNSTPPVVHNQLLRYRDTSYRYDGFGRMIEKHSRQRGRQTFGYDAEHRLIEVKSQNGKVVRMTYDPLGRRIGKTEHAPEGYELENIAFIWEGLRLLQEQRYGRTTLYVYADDGYEPLARVESQGTHSITRYYHNDVNGLPERLTDSDGKTVWSATFQIWGHALQETRDLGYGIHQNLRFQGQYLDRETGLHYNTFRYYDPDIGRFTTPDPIGLSGGINLYQYAPNPVGWIDPWGWSCTVITARSRRHAYALAKNHAQVPRLSRGGIDIPIDSVKETSRGRNWSEMKSRGARKIGREHEETGRSYSEHPDGHPDAGQPDIPKHHDSGHIHSINSKGEKVVFVW